MARGGMNRGAARDFMPPSEIPDARQTLVISGTADALVPSANASPLASRMPGAQTHRVHGGGHWCLLDRAAEVGPVIAAFLQPLEATAINQAAELG